MKNTASEVWNNCLSYIKDNINEESFKTWFNPIKVIKLKEKTLTIEVPSKFFYEWIEENYIDLLTSAIKKELGEEAKLVYSIMMENIYGNERPYTIKVPSVKKRSINNHKPLISVQRHAFSFYFKVLTATNFMDASFN